MSIATLFPTDSSLIDVLSDLQQVICRYYISIRDAMNQPFSHREILALHNEYVAARGEYGVAGRFILSGLMVTKIWIVPDMLRDGKPCIGSQGVHGFEEMADTFNDEVRFPAGPGAPGEKVYVPDTKSLFLLLKRRLETLGIDPEPASAEARNRTTRFFAGIIERYCEYTNFLDTYIGNCEHCLRIKLENAWEKSADQTIRESRCKMIADTITQLE